jgi:hypothetical protein
MTLYSSNFIVICTRLSESGGTDRDGRGESRTPCHSDNQESIPALVSAIVSWGERAVLALCNATRVRQLPPLCRAVVMQPRPRTISDASTSVDLRRMTEICAPPPKDPGRSTRALLLDVADRPARPPARRAFQGVLVASPTPAGDGRSHTVRRVIQAQRP